MANQKATNEQLIARKEAELARLKAKARKDANGQKIVLGGMLLTMAKNNPQVAQWTLKSIRHYVTREADLKRLKPIIEDLQKVASKADS